MKKIIFRTLTIFLTVTLLTSMTFASTPDDIVLLKKEQYLADFSDIKEDTGDTLSLDNSYSMYMYKPSVEKNKIFSEKLLADRYWMVVSENDTILGALGGNVWEKPYYKKSESSKWQGLGASSLPTFKDAEGQPLKIDFSVTGFSKIISEKIEGEILDFVVAYYEYNYLLYVKTTDMEYIIPYSSRPDFTGLENGKVYTAEKVEQILLDNLYQSSYVSTENKDENISPADYVGGVDGVAEKKDISAYIIVAITVVFLASAAVTLCIVKRKKRRKIK